MEHLTKPTLLAFILQMIGFVVYIPFSYIAYRWVRAPLKYEQAKQSLTQLGLVQTKQLKGTIRDSYSGRDYVFPILFASGVTLGIFALNHPYILQLGLTAGATEEIINVFGVDDFIPRAILISRVIWWGALGAYVYSFHLTFRRFLAYDLTPSVYIFTANRFVLALIVGGAVSIGVGIFATAVNITSLDVNIFMASLVAFFIGFFPEQGINWITATAQKQLKQQGNISKEKNLAEIEGLSIWHQGRLKQEGIENIQNLATADISALVVGTPFTVIQIVDWVDQAILLRHTSEAQFKALEQVGLICASDVLTNSTDSRHLQALVGASHLSKDELKVLRLSLLSALNIKVVSRFRWQSSMDLARVEEAVALQDTSDLTAVEISPGSETKTSKQEKQNLPKEV